MKSAQDVDGTTTTTTSNPNNVASGETVNISPLLQKLHPQRYARNPDFVSTEEIGIAITHVFHNRVSSVQAALLLYSLAITELEQRPDVLAKCASVMRAAAVPVDILALKEAVQRRKRGHGNYLGGLCDIVGTGGDFHSTFNISTTSSILASSLLVVGKHGNRASTSKSGSADVLANVKIPETPQLQNVGPKELAKVYEKTNYSFLFAPNFHTGLLSLSSVRKDIPTPTIFNLLGPLAHPADAAIEARVIGVKKSDLVKVFAEALRLEGVSKAMVVCGAENLDEISCAGLTNCAKLVDDGTSELPRIEYFTLSPADFGLPRHALGSVCPGLTPQENASILTRLLCNQTPSNDPIKEFVLMNTAALFVMSGICDGDTCAFGDGDKIISERGPGGGRWKEGVRLARKAITSGRAFDMLKQFIHVTHELHTADAASTAVPPPS